MSNNITIQPMDFMAVMMDMNANISKSAAILEDVKKDVSSIKDEQKKFIVDIERIKNKQESIDSSLSEIKKKQDETDKRTLALEDGEKERKTQIKILSAIWGIVSGALGWIIINFPQVVKAVFL